MILDDSDKCSVYEPLELDRSQITRSRKSFGSVNSFNGIRSESINEEINRLQIQQQIDSSSIANKRLSIVDILTREKLGKK